MNSAGEEFIISTAAAGVGGGSCGNPGKCCLVQLLGVAAVPKSSLEGTSQEVMGVMIIWNDKGKQ